MDLDRMFVDSAKEWIAEFEDNLLSLEGTPRNKELLNNIFRLAHNIKGSSGSAGLTEIYRFAHTIEDCLDLMRQDKLIPDRALIDALLEAADLISEMIGAVELKKGVDPSRYELWISRMDSLKKRGGLE